MCDTHFHPLSCLLVILAKNRPCLRLKINFTPSRITKLCDRTLVRIRNSSAFAAVPSVKRSFCMKPPSYKLGIAAKCLTGLILFGDGRMVLRFRFHRAGLTPSLSPLVIAESNTTSMRPRRRLAVGVFECQMGSRMFKICSSVRSHWPSCFPLLHDALWSSMYFSAQILKVTSLARLTTNNRRSSFRWSIGSTPLSIFCLGLGAPFL